ncbi:tetratricopeptide repeat protein [Lacimicrobium alkaliphilum]|uniref:Uncharacterized protein n=1 Tax=Lacimicrobium alkaliphilum TaxID=1526571 RepID=A0A0U3AI29_9ALTE|nr:tetratricopeptide repeat protein [Lacimicrobium alkaliphilum]ALS97666.1 hypothetical protein AT746_04855 [Lacimicrobium alkaliphilum]
MKFCYGRFSLLVLPLLLISTMVSASCFDMEWKRGKPFDYYAPETRADTGTYRGGLLYLVENRHFTPEIRSLTKGTSARQPGDILFVLNSIPNHPAALDAYSRYEKRYNESELFKNRMDTRKPVYPADCFFERADRVFPGNGQTMAVWGIHEYRYGRLDKARERLERAVALQPDNVEAHYNLGLVYADLKDITQAKKHAEIAYQAGYPLPGLHNKIAELENN